MKFSGKKRSIIFWGGTFLFLVANAFLLYNQLCNGDIFFSDYPPHIDFVLSNDKSQYSLYHLILAFVLRFVNAHNLKWFAFFLTIASNLVSLVATRSLIYESVSLYKKPGMLEDLFTISSHVLSMIISGLPAFHNYYAQWSPNPWHNPTYVFCRPFAVLTVLFMVRFFNAYHRQQPYAKYYLPLGVSCFLSVAAKPSFFFVFIVACFLYMLVELFLTRFSAFKAYSLLGLVLIPSAALIFFQNFLLFSDGPGLILTNGGVWKLYTPSVVVSVILGMAFPLYVVGWKVFTKQFCESGFFYHIALLTYGIGFAEFYFLAEGNDRFTHANFAWGYCFGMFFLFVASIVEFFLKDKKKSISKYIGAVLFLLHLISGIYYFCLIASGGKYA